MSLSIHSKKHFNFLQFRIPGFVFFVSLTLLSSVYNCKPSYAQVATLSAGNDTFSGSCPKSQCTMNQSNGRSVSLSTGITNSMNTSANAQSSPEYNSSSSSAMVLDSPLQTNSLSATDLLRSTYNSSQVSIGVVNPGDPIKLSITTSSTGNASTGTNTTSDYLDSKAQFEASGFSSIQDLRLKGGGSGSNSNDASGTLLRSDVTKLDKEGTIGTANASSSAQSMMKIQADITKNDFSNAFISSF